MSYLKGILSLCVCVLKGDDNLHNSYSCSFSRSAKNLQLVILLGDKIMEYCIVGFVDNVAMVPSLMVEDKVRLVAVGRDRGHCWTGLICLITIVISS